MSALDANRNYQLPNRAQWDFLAKISREAPATSVERAVLNPDGGTRQQPEPAGAAHATNRFGISDVFGNVSEMLADGKSSAGQSFLDFVVQAQEEGVMEFTRLEIESGARHVGLRVVVDSGMQSGAPR